MYTFKELPKAEFNSLAAVMEHGPTALAIEQAIKEFETDGDEDALLVELQGLNFTWNEINAIIVSGKRPRALYYAAGDRAPDIAARRPGKRTERLVMSMNVHV